MTVKKLPLTLAERQKRHLEKTKVKATECELLRSDVSASIRIINGALSELHSIAIDRENEKTLLLAIGQFEAALGLLNRERK